VGTGHAMSAREVRHRDARGGYRFEILGDLEADAQDLFKLLRERIRQGLSVRHVQQTEHGCQLTQAHRLRGVIEWDRETQGALPLLIVDGRTFTWDQIGRMLTFEGFTLNASVEDTIEVVGGPLADGRLESQAAHEPAPAVPAAVVRPGASNRKAATGRRPTRSWPPSPRRLDALIAEATVDAYGESEQATAFLTMLDEHLALPFGATVLGEAVVVEKIDLSDVDELIAMCRRRGKRQKVRLLDLELAVPRPKGAEWVAAYHRWARRR
jgi:Calcium binding